MSSYDRLGVHVSAGPRSVVRASARMLKPSCRRDATLRAERKRFYRRMLDAHRQHQALVAYWRL